MDFIKHFLAVGTLSFLFILPALGSGYANPDFSTKIYRNILVYVPASDIEFREKFEGFMVKRLSNESTKAITSISVFPPYKQFTKTELVKEPADRNIDAFLLIEPADAQEKSPPFPFNTYKLNSNQFNMSHLATKRHTEMTAVITIYDVMSSGIAWTGAVTLKTDGDDMLKDISKKITSEIHKTSLVENFEKK
jgi:hypothetical protein